MRVLRVVFVALLIFVFSLKAGALVITPTGLLPNASDPLDPILMGLPSQNSDSSVLAAIDPYIGTAELVYKQDQGEAEAVTFASSFYSTIFDRTPADPQDATIVNDGLSHIASASVFLVVKDGRQDPSWYLFNISGWNGMDTIEISGFWPNNGAISHVSLYASKVLEENPISAVPDGGSTVSLLGMILMGVAFVRGKLGK